MAEIPLSLSPPLLLPFCRMVGRRYGVDVLLQIDFPTDRMMIACDVAGRGMDVQELADPFELRRQGRTEWAAELIRRLCVIVSHAAAPMICDLP